MLKSKFDERIGVDRRGVQYNLQSGLRHLQRLEDPPVLECYTPHFDRYYTYDAGIGQNLAPMTNRQKQDIMRVYSQANAKLGLLNPAPIARGYTAGADKQTITQLESSLLKPRISYLDIMGRPVAEELVYDAMPFVQTNKSPALPHYDYLADLVDGQNGPVGRQGVLPGIHRYSLEKIERRHNPKQW
jgi:hypothetical protein